MIQEFGISKAEIVLEEHFGAFVVFIAPFNSDRPKRRVASVALHTSDVVEIVAKHACKWGVAIEWTSRSLMRRCAAVSLHLANSWDPDAVFMVSVAEADLMMRKVEAKTIFLAMDANVELPAFSVDGFSVVGEATRGCVNVRTTELCNMLASRELSCVNTLGAQQAFSPTRGQWENTSPPSCSTTLPVR